jgi:hypothetical protein
MATQYCQDCGAKNIYEVSPPKFCGSCGFRFGKVFSSKSSTPELEVPPLEETDSEGLRIPHIDRLSCDFGSATRKITIGDLASSPLDPNEISKTSAKIENYKRPSQAELDAILRSEMKPARQIEINPE